MSTVILFNNINKFTAMSNMNGSWFYWNSECKVMAVFFSSLGRNFSPWWWFGKKINLCFRKMPRTNLILIANFKSANVLRARVWKCVVSFSCLRKTKEKELVDSRFFFSDFVLYQSVVSSSKVTKLLVLLHKQFWNHCFTF